MASNLNPKPAPQRVGVLTVAGVFLLCSFSYLLGVYNNHSAGSDSLGAAAVSSSCHFSTPSAAKSAATETAELDFSAHHAADESTLAAADGGEPEFPACDAKYSEYTPCEDRDRSLRFARERLVYRERHCPARDELLRCLIPAPPGYRNPFPWPESRGVAWFANIPHRELVVEKANQNWVRVDGDKLRFPGGGTMFPRGADAYIDDIGRLINLSDGSVRTALDTGCGVASWGAYLLSRDIIAVSFAPRDTHEAQVQFALERGVPAMIGVLASHRLPYPSRAFDMAHCSRCLIPWHLYDGAFLIEIDRVLRPGGYWVLSGPPINWKAHHKGWKRTVDDLSAEQKAIESVAARLCWRKVEEAGDIAVWQKPTNHLHCKELTTQHRKVVASPPPPFCPAAQDPDAAWYTKMDACISPLPDVSELKRWPERLTSVPPRIAAGTVSGVTAESFMEDSEVWKKRVAHYKAINGQLAQGGRYRNVLDMNANLGGFAAALAGDPVWVMNVVPTAAEANTLGVVYERGLIGTYQDWCEAMSTYPRTYDLIHAASVITLYRDRCEMEDVLLEMDRVLRPEGAVIFRDDVDVLVRVKAVTERMRWDSQIVDHEDGPHQREKILVAVKRYWTAPDQSS